MNAFEEASGVEKRGLEILIPFLRSLCDDGRFVLTDKGRLSEMLQKTVGDVLGNLKDASIFGLEIKVEEEDKHGNFFLETWSNRSRFTVGWMFSLQTDRLWYFFLREQMLYSIPFNTLRQWAFGWSHNGGQIYIYPEKRQSKYEQRNDTWGRCVPIATVMAKVPGTHLFDLRDGEGSQ